MAPPTDIDLTPGFISEVIELAWADDVTFDAIQALTGLSEQQVITLMRRNLKPSSFRMWRRRVSGRQTKHAARSPLG
ncbi:MAG: TIGR03643 family protein [Pseudomonadota bacterium]